MNHIEKIKQWFELAFPEPTDKNKITQCGCHLEETAEWMLSFDKAEDRGTDETHVANCMTIWADEFKGANEEFRLELLKDIDKKAMLDALCDQIVTAIGVAHMFGMDISGALEEVNRSNFSKFVDGKPLFNEQGKIAKPLTYSPPDLDRFVGD